jgi:hypothetical protein
MKKITPNIAQRLNSLRDLLKMNEGHSQSTEQVRCLQRQDNNRRNNNSISGGSSAGENSSVHHLVNASDLDRWVKQADEYRELYMKAEQEL